VPCRLVHLWTPNSSRESNSANWASSRCLQMHSAKILAEVVDLVVFSSSLEKTPAIPVSGKSCRGSFAPVSGTVRLNQTNYKPRFTASAFVVFFAVFYSLSEAGDFLRVLSLSRVSKNVRCGFGPSGHRLSRSRLGGDTLVNRKPLWTDNGTANG